MPNLNYEKIWNSHKDFVESLEKEYGEKVDEIIVNNNDNAELTLDEMKYISGYFLISKILINMKEIELSERLKKHEICSDIINDTNK